MISSQHRSYRWRDRGRCTEDNILKAVTRHQGDVLAFAGVVSRHLVSNGLQWRLWLRAKTQREISVQSHRHWRAASNAVDTVCKGKRSDGIYWTLKVSSGDKRVHEPGRRKPPDHSVNSADPIPDAQTQAAISMAENGQNVARTRTELRTPSSRARQLVLNIGRWITTLQPPGEPFVCLISQQCGEPGFPAPSQISWGLSHL